MTISIVGTSEFDGTSSATTHAITLPNGIQAGDLICIWSSTQSSASDGAPTAPGFTQRYSQGHASSFRPLITLLYKIAAGTESGTSITLTWGVSCDANMVSVVFRGVDNTTPFDQTEPASTNGGSNPNPASITTVRDNAWVIHAVNGNHSTTMPTPTISTGYTVAISQVPDLKSLVIAYKQVNTAGAEDGSAWTWSTLDNHTSTVTALRPMKQGAGAADIAVTTSGTGKKGAKGAGAADIPVTTTATGQRTAYGAATASIAVSSSATGLKSSIISGTITGSGGLELSGEATTSFNSGGTQVDSNVSFLWDFDNDGDFSEAVEDITAYVLDAEVVYGRDFPSQLTGKSTSGSLRATLNNNDNRFSYFNSSSPLATDPFSLATGRKIRVQINGVTNPDPVLYAKDRFGGSGALSTDEEGNTWIAAYGPAFTRAGDVLGYAINNTLGVSVATLDLGVDDAYIQLRVKGRLDLPNGVALVYRWTDENNYGFLYLNNQSLLHGYWDSGVRTDVSSYVIESQRPDITIGIRVVDNTAYCFADGVLVSADVSLAYAGAGQEFGMYSFYAGQQSPRIDEFYAWDHDGIEADGIIWTGTVSACIPGVDNRHSKTAILTAEGPITRLAAVDITPPISASNSGTSAGSKSGLMVGSCLSQADLLHPPPPNGLAEGTFNLGTVGLTDNSAFDAARIFEEAEFGFIKETPEGYIAYEDRDTRASKTSLATFSDSTSARLGYENIEALDWRKEIINRVSSQVSPSMPTFGAFNHLGNTVATVANPITITLPSAANGAAEGDLLLAEIISTVYTEDEFWNTPNGWTDLRGATADPYRQRWYAKKMVAGDLGGTATFYEDTGASGGSWRANLYLIQNWYGSIDQGIAISSAKSYGPPNTQGAANGGAIEPDVVFPPWGRSASLFITSRTAAVSSGGSIVQESVTDATLPSGYGNGSALTADNGDLDYAVAIEYAIREGITEVENAGAFTSQLTGFDYLEATTVAIRGDAGSDNPASGGAVVTSENRSSQERHNIIRTHDNAADIFPDITEAVAYNTVVLNRHGSDRPIFRIGFTATKTASHRAQAYRRRLSDKITLTAANNSGMGVSGTFFIEAIRHRWSDGIKRWFTEWELSPDSVASTPGDVIDNPDTGGGGGEEPLVHTVEFRSQDTLSAPTGSPEHVLAALGYTGTYPITRAALDGILDNWLTSTGGTIYEVDNSTEWTNAMAAVVPGDLVRVTTSFTADLTCRGNKYGISGSNLTASPSGGTAGLPIILTCADGIEVTGTSTSNDDGTLDVFNVDHVWPIGFNTIGGQFGIRCWNWAGTSSNPVYRAYCNVSGTGHSGMIASGWFQLITSSGGTPPSGSGNEWGFCQYFVDEENYVEDVGNIANEFGECYYYGHGDPGWVSYCKDFWHRGNEGTLFTADGIDLKPGCHRFVVNDNEYHGGYCVSGSPMTICYVYDGIPDRPSGFNFDIAGYIYGNRVWDINITSSHASSANIGAYSGLSGLRWWNNMFWGIKQTGFTGGIYLRMELGINDANAIVTFRTDPTEFINNLYWGTSGAVVKGGYGVGVGFPDPFPAAVLAVIVERNNLADNTTGAQFAADASDFYSPSDIPAVGAAGAANWDSHGPGSAFDLDPDSALVGTGSSISDLSPIITKDIAQRDYQTAINPGPFQPDPADL